MLARMVSISSPPDLPALASQNAGITGVSHHTQIDARHFLYHLFRGTGFPHVDQAGLELLASSDLSASAFQSVG